MAITILVNEKLFRQIKQNNVHLDNNHDHDHNCRLTECMIFKSEIENRISNIENRKSNMNNK